MYTKKLLTAYRVLLDEGKLFVLKVVLDRLILRILRIKLIKNIKEQYILKKFKRWKIPKHDITFIIKSNISYFHHLPQRPIHIANALAKEGYKVIYITKTEGKGDIVFGIKRVNTNIFITDEIDVFLKYFTNAYSMILLDPTLSLSLYNKLKKQSTVIYDYLDDIDERVTLTDVTPFLKVHNKILKDKSNIVMASSKFLVSQALKQRSEVHLVENACDTGNFQSEKDISKVTKKMQDVINLQLPIIGFFGALASWVDYQLIEDVAKKNTGYSFVLIGPNYDNTYLPLKKKKIPNIHFIGPVPYKKLKHYSAWFDVSIIPFLVEQITHAVSPIKLFEYMAIGKPIVATKTQELERYNSVLLSKNADEFSDHLYNSIKGNLSKNYFLILQQELSCNTWQSRAKKILSFIKNNKY